MIKLNTFYTQISNLIPGFFPLSGLILSCVQDDMYGTMQP